MKAYSIYSIGRTGKVIEVEGRLTDDKRIIIRGGIWEYIGEHCFLTYAEARQAGMEKLQTALIAAERSVEKLREQLAKLESEGK